MGLVCQINDTDNPLDIVVPSQWHFDNKKYTMLEPEMKIKIKVARKRHENGDNHISVVGALFATPFDEDHHSIKKDDSDIIEEEDEDEDDEKDEDDD
jgi:hypothetical protein